MAWAPSNFQGKQEQRKVFQNGLRSAAGDTGAEGGGTLAAVTTRTGRGATSPTLAPSAPACPRASQPPPGRRSPRSEPASMRNVLPKPRAWSGSPSPRLSLLTSLGAVRGHSW